MSIWKRATSYLVRKKGQSILMITLMFVMCCLAFVGISLESNAVTELENLRRSMGSGFVLKADIDNMGYYEPSQVNSNAKIYKGPVVTDEFIDQILCIDGVTGYDIETLFTPVWSELKLRPGLWANSQGDGYLSKEKEELWMKTTLAWSCQDGEMQKNFRTGALTISAGRNIRKEDRFKVVISEWLAKENGLSVGDTITVMLKEGAYQPTNDPLKTWGEPIELEIVGLFRMNFEQKVSEYTSESDYMENIIYSDMETYMKTTEILKKYMPEGEISENAYTKVSFLVEEPKRIDTIMEKVKAMGEAEGLRVLPDDTAYKAASKPYAQIQFFSRALLAVGIGGMGVLLYLLMRLRIQGRIHEAGILLSVGIGKGKIVGQMLVENLMVSVIAVVLAVLLSGVFVDTCAGFAERITAPKKGGEAYEMEISKVGDIEVSKTASDRAELEHHASGRAILLGVVLVCGVSGVSVLFASIKITDMEPRRLLNFM